ncbi:MAG: porin family protein [Bacteroidales bacterium]
MKFLIGLLTAILITGIASAQHGNSPTGHINIGIKGGVNVYNVHNDNNIKYDPRIGFNFGLLGHIHLNNQFAIQPELVYSAQGAIQTVDNGTNKLNLDYINVPVLLQYMFDNGLRLQAGPQVGFLVSAKSNSIDVKNDMNPIDLALSFGASYVFPATGWGIDARYNLGLSNINKNGTVNSTNRGFQLGIFYILGH